jgi:hypothetical protein
MWAAVYFMHAFVGVGIFMLGAAMLWSDLVNQPLGVRVAPMAVGLVLGLLLAERSRRRGTLLGRPRPPSNAPTGRRDR